MPTSFAWGASVRPVVVIGLFIVPHLYYVLVIDPSRCVECIFSVDTVEVVFQLARGEAVDIFLGKLFSHTVGHCYSSSYHFLHVSCFRGNTTPPQGVVTVHNCPTISLCKTRGPTWNFRFYTKDLSLLADDNAAVPYTTYIIRPYIEPIYVYFTFRYRL
jgi:hypothetical protein